MKDWYFRRHLKSSNVCVGLYTTRISDFVFRRCRFPNSLLANTTRRRRGRENGVIFPYMAVTTPFSRPRRRRIVFAKSL